MNPYGFIGVMFVVFLLGYLQGGIDAKNKCQERVLAVITAANEYVSFFHRNGKAIDTAAKPAV